jgi:hypothetical protein
MVLRGQQVQELLDRVGGVDQIDDGAVDTVEGVRAQDATGEPVLNLFVHQIFSQVDGEWFILVRECLGVQGNDASVLEPVRVQVLQVFVCGQLLDAVG